MSDRCQSIGSISFCDEFVLTVSSTVALADRIVTLKMKGDTQIFDTVVRLNFDTKFSKKMIGKDQWDVIGITFADCNKKILRFEKIGVGIIVSNSQLGVTLDKLAAEEQQRIFELFPLHLPPEDKRVAFLFVSKNAEINKQKFLPDEGAKLVKELSTQIVKKSAFIAFPVPLGFGNSSSLNATCSCKKIDLTSSCSCTT